MHLLISLLHFLLKFVCGVLVVYRNLLLESEVTNRAKSLHERLDLIKCFTVSLLERVRLLFKCFLELCCNLLDLLIDLIDFVALFAATMLEEIDHGSLSVLAACLDRP